MFALLKACSVGLPGDVKSLAKRAVKAVLPFYAINLLGDYLNKLIRTGKAKEKDILKLRNSAMS